MKSLLWVTVGAVLAMPAIAQDGDAHLALTGDIVGIHDPVIIRERDNYWIFSTNGDSSSATIRIRGSKDLRHWTARGHVFDELPAWASQRIPGADGAWAPDISFVNGRYLLYYSVSTFGSNRSVIGLVTNQTLDPESPDYRWHDEGLVLESMPDSDFNAIDPNHVVDRQGRHWLTLGSYWTGIKLFELDRSTGKLLKPARKPVSLARRRAPEGGGRPVEAPFIVARPDHYYLFVSYDYCCKGVESTYYVTVGRAKKITGPYAGRDGSKLMDGEGTLVIPVYDDAGRFRGQGHNGFLRDDGRDYVVYHAYDRDLGGKPVLRIAAVTWDAAGWPGLARSGN